MTLNAPAPMTEPKRDRWGRPLILQPDGKRAGYTRVTTVAKTLEDEGSLANWKMRQVAVGLARRPDLLALASTAVGDKSRLDKITQQALDAAASDARANLGTALHSIVEQLGLGLPVDILPDLAGDIDAWRRTSQGLGIEAHETFVVNDTHQYAGTFDFVMRHPHTGALVIGDLKTGADLSYSWRSIAVQLAAYANAEHRYHVDTDTRLPMPDIDRSVGIIVHLPAGEGRCEIHEVDLVAGHEALMQSLWTRTWRRSKVSRPIELLGLESDRPAQVPPPKLDERRQWLRDRVTALAAGATGVLDELAARWPDGVPTPLSAVTADAHLDAVAAVVDRIEARLRAPFPETDDPGDGGDADPEAVRAAMWAAEQVDQRTRPRLAAVIDEATAAGTPLSLRRGATVRRCEQAHALMVAAALHGLDDEICRHTLCVATEDPAVTQLAVPLGRIVGALTIAQARMWRDLLTALHEGRSALSWTTDGLPTVIPTTNTTKESAA